MKELLGRYWNKSDCGAQKLKTIVLLLWSQIAILCKSSGSSWAESFEKQIKECDAWRSMALFFYFSAQLTQKSTVTVFSLW